MLFLTVKVFVFNWSAWRLSLFQNSAFGKFKALSPTKITFIFCLFILAPIDVQSQSELHPKAKFSFDNKNDRELINGKKIKTQGTSFCEDRFGNANNAIYLFGNEFSYVNLGNYPALKPKVGSISVWFKIERDVWSGKGYRANPIILTKSRKEDNFFEAYGIYFELESKKVTTSSARDSLRQVVVQSNEAIKMYEWHHAVITYDSSFFNLYLDGELQRKAIKKYETAFMEGDSVLVGFSANKKNSRYMEGAVDDIQFFDKVLTEREVDELYQEPNPNRFRLYLSWGLQILALVLFIAFVVWLITKRYKAVLQKEQDKNKLNAHLNELETKAIRSQMNPHFMFNSLNTLQRFILEKDVDNAHLYLTKFSRLLRKMLESSTSDSISLAEEISILDQYIELENLRSDNSFEYEISNSIADSEKIFIPIMLIQPFVENAIWHGLMARKENRKLKVSFVNLDEKRILCVVDDNGGGREQSLKKKDPFKKKSLASEFIKQRLELIEKSSGISCSYEFIDKKNETGQSLGTTVNIILPKLNTL